MNSTLTKAFPFRKLSAAVEPHSGRLTGESILTVDLRPRETATAAVRNGRNWLTIEGDSKDYIIGSGEELFCSSPGRTPQRQQRESGLTEFFERAPSGLDVLSEDGVMLEVNQTECEIRVAL